MAYTKIDDVVKDFKQKFCIGMWLSDEVNLITVDKWMKGLPFAFPVAEVASPEAEVAPEPVEVATAEVVTTTDSPIIEHETDSTLSAE